MSQYRHVREVAASWLSSRHESIDQLGLDEYHRAHFGERGLNRHLHRSYVQASTNTRHNQDAVVIEGLSSDEELGEAADSDSEHSFLEGNVSNAASDSSEINTSSDEEAHVISRLPHRRQSVIVISDESEDEDDIEDESNAGSDSGDERAVTSQASSSDVDASDSDSGYSDLSCGSGAMSVVEEEEEVDASANSSAKFTCPICQEEKSNLSCGKCGHVFCTLSVSIFVFRSKETLIFIFLYLADVSSEPSSIVSDVLFAVNE